MKRTSCVCLLLCLSFLVSFQGANSAVIRRRNPHITSDLLPKGERQKDFMEWVYRVGSKKHSTKLESAPLRTSKIVGDVITVDKNGNGNFTTVQAAIRTVPTNNNKRIVIRIGAGVYREKVSVPNSKHFITFQGAGREVTTITWHDTASSAGSTTESASVAVDSDFFIARDITFQNSAPAPPLGSTNKQAVALRISGDKAAFYNCSFNGNQDTLFDANGRHYFENCFIRGSVDFICGDGQSLYKGCELESIPRSYGSLTAQKRSSPSDNTGFSFVNCKVTGSGMIYLGRAWGRYSRVVFSYTYMDAIIKREGWYNWGDRKRERSVFYGQYKCSGPGSNRQGRVAWSRELTDAEAAPFQSVSFIDGESWLET